MHILDYHSHLHGTKVLYAIAESFVPKIAVLIRKAYGAAKPAMGIDKDIGIDHANAKKGKPISQNGTGIYRCSVNSIPP